MTGGAELFIVAIKVITKARIGRILLVDDSQIVLETMRDALEPAGISVAGLDELTDLEKVRALDEYDLVLLDVHMPDAFVDEVAILMRRRSGLSAPVVLLSSLPEAELAARAQASNLDGYILKDYGVDGIAAEIRAWLDGERPRLAQQCG